MVFDARAFANIRIDWMTAWLFMQCQWEWVNVLVWVGLWLFVPLLYAIKSRTTLPMLYYHAKTRSNYTTANNNNIQKTQTFFTQISHWQNEFCFLFNRNCLVFMCFLKCFFTYSAFRFTNALIWLEILTK